MLEQLWDGSSPFTARLATPSEELDYGLMYQEMHEELPCALSGESVWYFYSDIVSNYCTAKRERDEPKAKAA
jgi:hypothetical protein